MTKKLVGIDCRHAFYGVSEDKRHDVVMVKEYQHFDDGTREMHFRMLKDFEREFYITKPAFRNHKDKKEWEFADRVDTYKCTQLEMPYRISQILRIGGSQPRIRELCNNPFIYGTDISTSSIVKKRYKLKYPDLIPEKATVAALDIETSVKEDFGKINMVSIIYKVQERYKVYLCATKGWVDGHPNFEYEVIEKANKYIKHPTLNMQDKENVKLGDLLAAMQLDIEVVIVKDGAEASVKCIQKAHEWRPDFISIWNIDFDLPKMINEIREAGYDVDQVFCDPLVPEEFRRFRYVEGKKQKLMDSGKMMPLAPTDIWHKPMGLSSFQFIDSMVFYKRLRVAKGNEPNYTLDGVLERRLGLRKLKFEELVPYTKGLGWHRIMQANYKPEYAVYNIWDSLSLLLLDDKIGDIQTTYPIIADITDHANFTSNPKIIGDAMYYYSKDNGRVFGSTGSVMEDELDKFVVGKKFWIAILPTFTIADNGMACVVDSNAPTMIRAHLSDIDIEASYPSIQIFMNISKETTHRELSRIEGVNDKARRALGFNLTAGVINSIEICESVFSMPPMAAWDACIDEEFEEFAA